MGLTTCGITMTLDGFVAGPNQRFEMPFGDVDENLMHQWMFGEPDLHKRERDAILDAGAFIMGSNMFGPKDRREQPEWKGWWGDDPPYHAPTYILSTHKRAPIQMEGGTTFFFINDGVESAHRQAKAAAGERNVAVMGGASTVNQFLAAGLIDELWLHIAPVTFGSGARLFEGVPNLRLEPLETGGSKSITHIRYKILK